MPENVVQSLIEISKAKLIHSFQGTLEDGTEFDSSYRRGAPFFFKIGFGNVSSTFPRTGKFSECEVFHS